MKAIQFNGSVNTSQLRSLDIPIPIPGKGEVRIRVEAYAFIPDADDVAGIAGTIDAVGSVSKTLQRGNHVFGLATGAVCAQYSVLNAENVAQIPSNITVAQAAALAVPAMLGHMLLTEIGRLRWGQRLLMRNAAGDIAKTILQAAKAMGVHITATANRADINLLQTLGADRCLEDVDGDFLESLADMVLQFANNGTLLEIRFPKHNIKLPANASIAWQQNNQQRLQYGKALVETGKLSVPNLPQVSWKVPAVMQAALRKEHTGQIVIILD